MMTDLQTIREDFDHLAQFSSDDWDHNSHYHPFLLRHLPARMQYALDIGCGTGYFARQLAARAAHVTAVDLSPKMIALAQERSAAFNNLSYQVADIMTLPLPADHFDCVASIATLHHLPLDTVLERLVPALKPGGWLLVLDLFTSQHLHEIAYAALALPVNYILTRRHHGRQHRSAEAKLAWEQHGAHDHYLTLDAVRQTARAQLPGARIRQHLLWRYSLVWQKPIERQD